MIERDNKDILLYNTQMENVRLNNENASLRDYISFLENELKSIEDEHAQELSLKDEFIADQAKTISTLRKEKEDAMEDVADARKELGEARAVILSLQGMIIESNAERTSWRKRTRTSRNWQILRPRQRWISRISSICFRTAYSIQTATGQDT